MKITNKLTGLMQDFDFRFLDDFKTQDDYINYVCDMYIKNPWALEEYHRHINQVEPTDSYPFMNAVCQSFQAHKKKVFMPEYVLKKHQSLHCEINKILRNK